MTTSGIKTADGQDIVIVGAKRSALGSFMGALSSLPAPQIGAAVVRSLVQEYLHGKTNCVDALVCGNVLSAGLGQAPARQVALYAELERRVDCLTINKMCGSGLKAISLAADAVRMGRSQCVIAGGIESMSRAPHLLMESRSGYRMGHQSIVDSMISDGLWDVYNDKHMGNCAETCAAEFKFTREAQDMFAISSYRRAQEAQQQGWFADEIATVDVPQRKGDPLRFDTDEEPGRVNFDKVSSLRAVFQKDGTVTAANASTINDGAAFVVITTRGWAERNQCPVLARITGYAEVAQEPEWFTTAPVAAIQNATEQIGMQPNSLDLYEINEAFAVVPMAAIQKHDLPADRVNVFGGAISLGHPIGCSGARVLVTLLNALKHKDLRKGLATLCIGGGEAAAMTVERVS